MAKKSGAPKNNMAKDRKAVLKELVRIAREHKAGVIKKKTLGADIDNAINSVIDGAFTYGYDLGRHELTVKLGDVLKG